MEGEVQPGSALGAAAAMAAKRMVIMRVVVGLVCMVKCDRLV